MSNVFRCVSIVPALTVLLGFAVHDLNQSVWGQFMAQLPSSSSSEVADESDNNPQNAEPSVRVQQINVVGSTVFDDDDWAEILAPFENQDLTVEKIRQVADEITQLYLNRGYVTTRAVPVASATIGQDGILTIKIFEGEITEIEIIPIELPTSTEERNNDEANDDEISDGASSDGEISDGEISDGEGSETANLANAINDDSSRGSFRVRESYIRNRIQLGTTIPFNSTRLENQLRLLRSDPLFASVEASLQPTGEQGKSKLIVRVIEANPFSYGFSTDNYSPPSVGSERVSLTLSHRNLTGNGDELSASYLRSTTSGAENYNVLYRIPVNAMNGAVQLRAAPNNFNITDPEFIDLNIRGEQELYEITYRQPLVRSPREELALSAGFKYQSGQTFIGDLSFPFGIGPDEDAFSRTSILNFGQDYIRRDSRGAWSVRSQFDFGTGLFDATTNDEPIPDGHFFSWLGQAQRVQQLSQDHLLLIQGELQLTPDSLLPAQRFIIGGGQSTRGYRQNARSGDNGLRFSIEDRITVNRNSTGAPIIQLAPFWDVGAVWNSGNNPNELTGTTLLSGTGFGLIFDQVLGQDGLKLRVDLGIPLVDWENKGDNLQDSGIYFNLRYGR
ncbi:MAG: ShlB/FhaC/HecB family hemolysin secretion/activation protein [Cyanobacteria bacterium P01_F01_bin.150]